MSSKGKAYQYEQVQQVAEPMPVSEPEPNWEGMSLFITALAGLVTAIGSVWGKRKLARHVEKKRETNPDYLKLKRKK